MSMNSQNVSFTFPRLISHIRHQVCTALSLLLTVVLMVMVVVVVVVLMVMVVVVVLMVIVVVVVVIVVVVVVLGWSHTLGTRSLPPCPPPIRVITC